MRIVSALICLCAWPSLASAGPAITADNGSVCWIAPKRLATTTRKHLSEAMAAAAERTRPAHALLFVAEIPNKSTVNSEVASKHCRAIVSLVAKSVQKRGELRVEINEPVSDKFIGTTTASVDLSKLVDTDLVGAWRVIWRLAAPPPPPTPPVAEAKPPPPPEKPFVDEELRTERAVESAPEPKETPVLSFWLVVGLMSRNTADAPGTPINESALLSLGGEAALHLAKALSMHTTHTLDLEAGYARRLAQGSFSNAAIGVTADRLDLSALYRYRLGNVWAPSVGPELGFEMLRVEVEPMARALSARYGVVRGGLSAWQPIPLVDGLRLGLRVDLALRLSPGADGGDAGLAFDAGGGLELALDNGLVFRGRARYARQNGLVGASNFSDGFLDLDLGVGFAL